MSVRFGVQPAGTFESPRIITGADRQRLHSGCSVKYGATSQLASKASTAVSKTSV